MTTEELLDMTDNMLSLLEKGIQLPSFSSTIQRLMQLGDGTDYAAHELAAIILEDYGLISKVLSTVNSFYYNRTGREITTVTQAVITLGFDLVKELAISMAILDVAAKRGSGLLPKLIAQAFWSAHFMLEAEQPENNEEMEEIFLATLFYPLARIVVAIADENVCQQLIIAEQDADIKKKQLVKWFWQKAGRQIAGYWAMPLRITRYMEGAIKAETDRLQRLQKKIQQTYACINSYVFNQTNTKQSMNMIPVMTDLSQNKIAEYLLRSLETTKKEHDIIKQTLKAINITAESEIKVKDQHISSLLLNKDTSMLALIAELTETILQPQVSINDIYMMAIEIVIRGMDMDTVALCLLSKDRKRLIVRLGAGSMLGELRRHLRLEMDEPCNFLEAFFSDFNEKIYSISQVPDLGARLADSKQKVCLSPLVVRGKKIGLFLFLKPEGGSDFSAAELLYLKNIRNLMMIATEQRTSKSHQA